MLSQPATTLRMRMTPRLNGLPVYGEPYGTKMDNVLDPRDQIWFDYGRATGVSTLVQWVWVYNRPINIDGLRQFHDHLRRGRLSRRIERSPLPFGRHRWISADGSSDMKIVAAPRPREEFDAWLNEQADTPIDAEHGPGWHLAALPFTDGGAGVSLVISHCLTDGPGLCEALADAALGRDDPISWPAAASRRRWQALREDARQTARDTPAFGRAVVAAVRLARRGRGGAGLPPAGFHATYAARRHRRTDHAPNGNDLRRCRRVGGPRTLTRRDQQRAACGIGGPPRPASGTGYRRRLGRLDDAGQRARRRRYSRQRLQRMSTSRSTLHL